MRKTLSFLGVLVVLFWPLLLWRDSVEFLRQQKTFHVGVHDKKASEVFGLSKSSAAVSSTSSDVPALSRAKLASGGVGRDVIVPHPPATSVTLAPLVSLAATSSASALSLVSTNFSAMPVAMSSGGFGGGSVGGTSHETAAAGGGSSAAGRDFDDETCPLL